MDIVEMAEIAEIVEIVNGVVFAGFSAGIRAGFSAFAVNWLASTAFKLIFKTL